MPNDTNCEYNQLTFVPTTELISELVRRSPFAHVTVGAYDRGNLKCIMVGNLKSAKDAESALARAADNLMVLFNVVIKKHGVDKYRATDIINPIIHGENTGFGEGQFS